MSSCERVLQIRPDVIEKVRQQAKLRSSETADQLDLLLSTDRSTEMLMDKTLNVSAVITAHNVEKLIQDMKESLIAEKISEYKTATAQLRRETRTTIERTRKDAEEAVEREISEKNRVTGEAAQLQAYVTQIENEDRESVDALILDVNSKILKRKKANDAIRYAPCSDTRTRIFHLGV